MISHPPLDLDLDLHFVLSKYRLYSFCKRIEIKSSNSI